MFSAYLWGIETYRLWCSWWRCNSFQHTYEGLKHLDNARVMNAVNCRFQHTYEGLKREIYRQYRNGEYDPFSAYLWGIETFWKVNGGDKGGSFQHTYEGLKRISKESSKFLYFCFQHTYEGLKQGKCAGCAGYWGVVFSIPMRDWNNAGERMGASSHPSFKHTYEGLKPAGVAPFRFV